MGSLIPNSIAQGYGGGRSQGGYGGGQASSGGYGGGQAASAGGYGGQVNIKQ